MEVIEGDSSLPISSTPAGNGIERTGRPEADDSMKRLLGSSAIPAGALVSKVLPKPTVISNVEANLRREPAAVSANGTINFRVRKRRLAATKDDSKCGEGESLAAAALFPPTKILSSSEFSSTQTEAQPVQRAPGVSTSSAENVSLADESIVRRSSRVQARRTAKVDGVVVSTESTTSASRQSKASTKKSVKASKQNENVPKRRPRAPRPGTISDLDPAKQQGSTKAEDYWHNSLSKETGRQIPWRWLEKALTVISESPAKVLRAMALGAEDSTDALMLPIVAGRTSLSTPQDVAAALEHLKSVDDLLRAVIEKHDGPQFQKCESTFAALARSIVFQQLATKAAAVIFGRLLDACQGMDNFTPANISILTTAQLRAVGLSERKASYLHHLAANFTSGALSDSSILEMDDEALMKALTAVKGIGVWSVHMFMMFALHRPDVLPVGDLGVRKGFQQLYQLKNLPTPAEVEEIASRWKPYRSLGSWYMWRVINNVPPLKPS